MSESAATKSPPIVVGVDGSEPSIEALRWAVRYAELIGADVDAVISWHYPVNYGTTGFAPVWNPEQDAGTTLARTVDAVVGRGTTTKVSQIVCEGNAAKVLLDQTKDAQMLVVGSRGHGGFAGLLLGSVSASCAEHASCPVLVIHGKVQS
jgi:nucleotide-binding universal stress UspA family protein